MIQLKKDHRAAYGVEPICRLPPIAPATFQERLAKRADPVPLPARAKRDEELKAQD